LIVTELTTIGKDIIRQLLLIGLHFGFLLLVFLVLKEFSKTIFLGLA
jgi:hypothetical protein